MKCDVVQNRLLALPDPRRVPDELRGHLADCEACRSFLALAGRLDEYIAAVPVPPSDDAVRLAFLDRLTAVGPIITRIPTFTRTDSSATLRAVLARTGRWRTVAGLAAGVLVAVGLWLGLGGRSDPVPTETALRHELLEKQVRHVARLAKAETAPDRLAILADLAADYRTEARSMYLAAQDPEMRTLARMYDKTVAQGIVLQAEQLPPHMNLAERRELFRTLDERLRTDEQDAAALAAQAPPTSQPGLLRIAESARSGRAKLQALAGRGGA